MDNLDRDSARALALGYGVHYGRYKVDYPNTMDESEPPEIEVAPPGICRRCGKPFTPKHHNERYCSDECRRDPDINPNLARQSACKVCGGVIPEGSRRKRYCSDECAEEGNRLLTAELYRRKKRNETVGE